MNHHLKFIIASSPGHYQAAQRLFRDEHLQEKQSLSFPTILAWDGDQLVGVCGTRIIDKMIVAGPLVVRSDQRRIFTVMRLAEAYDEAMYGIGISSYIVSAEYGSLFERAIKRYFPDLQPYSTSGGSNHYIWKVKGYGRRREGSTSLARGKGPAEEPGGTVGAAAPNH